MEPHRKLRLARRICTALAWTCWIGGAVLAGMGGSFFWDDGPHGAFAGYWKFFATCAGMAGVLGVFFYQFRGPPP